VPASSAQGDPQLRAHPKTEPSRADCSAPCSFSAGGFADSPVPYWRSAAVSGGYHSMVGGDDPVVLGWAGSEQGAVAGDAYGGRAQRRVDPRTNSSAIPILTGRGPALAPESDANRPEPIAPPKLGEAILCCRGTMWLLADSTIGCLAERMNSPTRLRLPAYCPQPRVRPAPRRWGSCASCVVCNSCVQFRIVVRQATRNTGNS
jgi:hypothetical protein